MVELVDSTLGVSAPTTPAEVEILRCWRDMDDSFHKTAASLMRQLADEYTRSETKGSHLQLAHIDGAAAGRQKGLDARLLAAFHAVDLEDMWIVINYVEFIADNRRSKVVRRGHLTLVNSDHAPSEVISFRDASCDSQTIGGG